MYWTAGKIARPYYVCRYAIFLVSALYIGFEETSSYWALQFFLYFLLVTINRQTLYDCGILHQDYGIKWDLQTLMYWKTMFDCCYCTNSMASGLNIPLQTWQMLMHDKLCLILILKVHKSQIFGNNFFWFICNMQIRWCKWMETYTGR